MLQQEYYQMFHSSDQRDQEKLQAEHQKTVETMRIKLEAQQQLAKKLQDRRQNGTTALFGHSTISTIDSGSNKPNEGLSLSSSGAAAWRRPALWEGGSVTCRRLEAAEETSVVLVVCQSTDVA